MKLLTKICFGVSLLLQPFGLSAHCADAQWVLDYVSTTPNFPRTGIDFKWYSALMKDPDAFSKVIHIFVERYRSSPVDAIVGLDSRGFIFGAALAYELKLPFVVIRKAGKLPGDVLTVNYGLHYGADSFQIENHILKPGQNVVIIDDVIATGGTSRAAGQLVEQLGALVYETAFLLEAKFLNGRENSPYPVFSVVTVEGN